MQPGRPIDFVRPFSATARSPPPLILTKGAQSHDVKAYVGVTDGEWYRFLSSRPELSEINFWRPSGKQSFRVLQPGEPFFFKSHYPGNSVVGGGFYSGFAKLRISEAWELFGEGNGVESLAAMRERIKIYRREPISPHEDPVIGCILIRDPRFFPEGQLAAPPPDFASNIVQGKGYDLSASPPTSPVASYFEGLLARLLDRRVEIDFSEPWHRSGPVYGDPRLVPQRLGQQAFKAVVQHAYGHRCAITGSKIRPALQAAHIRPLSQGGDHRIDNGLLLRSDVHTLFDRGYLSVDPDYRLLVSPRLREEFGNGDWFYERSGRHISVPERRADRPSRKFLEWHNENVFRAPDRDP